MPLEYSPPLGPAGAMVASLFGGAPDQHVREDLRRFKALMEAGDDAAERLHAVQSALISPRNSW